MLEKIREYSQSWLAKIVLALIVVPFALWGIDSYLKGSINNMTVASVGKEKITINTYSSALQNLRYRLQSEGKTAPEVLDSLETKYALLSELINQQLLTIRVSQDQFMPSDAALGDYITHMSEFQRDGKFSPEAYGKILVDNQMTVSKFESRLRSDIAVDQLKNSIMVAPLVSDKTIQDLAQIIYQQREIRIAKVTAESFLKQVASGASEITEYYNQHKSQFMQPEQVKLSYVLFSANNLLAHVNVSDADVQRYYQENLDQFQGNKKVRASHILLVVDKAASAQDKTRIREKAASILGMVKRNPAQFGQLAKQYSQDVGSAEQGGDLGFFSKGAMVKAFEDKVFSMKKDEISDLIETEFGYHIVKLTGVEGSNDSFDSVKPRIRGELMYQKALKEYMSKLEAFKNTLYEQYDALEPAAKVLDLEIKHTDWMSREQAVKFFNNPTLVNAIFSHDVLKEKRNTEAIEFAPNAVISARVVEYKPIELRKADAVKVDIEQQIKHMKAAELAQKEGGVLLKQLKERQEAPVTWSEPVFVSRNDRQGLNSSVFQAVFRLNGNGKLPTYAGVQDQKTGDYILIKLTQVQRQSHLTAEEVQSLKSEIQRLFADEYLSSYLGSLRSKSNVKINQKLLNG